VVVTTPLLKFVSEFVFNKSQRLTFDSSSPNGILLFREVRNRLVAKTALEAKAALSAIPRFTEDAGCIAQG
jgi:hypothetical protein